MVRTLFIVILYTLLPDKVNNHLLLLCCCCCCCLPLCCCCLLLLTPSGSPQFGLQPFGPPTLSASDLPKDQHFFSTFSQRTCKWPFAQSCRCAGCTSPPCCTVGNCSQHCTNPAVPTPPILSSPQGRPVGRHRWCFLWVSLTSRSATTSHLTTVTPMPATSSGSFGARLICQRAGCQEPVHPECTTPDCNIHHHSPETAGGRRLY